MFCYQCQEAAEGTGCTKEGVCGKNPETAAMQDLLVYVTKGLACVVTQLYVEGRNVDLKTCHLITQNLSMTLTNMNFDSRVIAGRVERTLSLKRRLLARVENQNGLCEAAIWDGNKKDFRDKARSVGITATCDEDTHSLKELITYGLKGLAAYVRNANALRKEDRELEAYIQSALARTLDNELSVEGLIDLALQTGEYGLKGMALLDQANTAAYGNPVLSTVDIGVRDRPGILVSGHDLRDLEMLLEQTKGMGVDIYTHSEMLPAHYYPAFKRYPHLVGNYGNSWWQQKEEFDKFHGPILMTSNCIVPPAESYKNRLWTTGTVSFPGCRHIAGNAYDKKSFSGIIAQALKCPPPEKNETGSITGGFAHRQTVALSELIVDGIKTGKIRKIVVMAGCDGRMKTREYYTEFARRLPGDVIILTAGCVKYRFNKLDLGNIGGIPRVIDVGQCNDSYSIVLIALALKDLLRLNDINDLPIAYNISWYEQKAVMVLLSLLYLGVTNIHIGPTLPAFLSPGVIRVLEERFGITGICSVEKDLELV